MLRAIIVVFLLCLLVREQEHPNEGRCDLSIESSINISLFRDGV